MFFTILTGAVIANVIKAAAVTVTARTVYDASRKVSEAVTRRVLK